MAATVWVEVGRQTAELVRSEWTEVDKCQVDALTLLSTDDPWPVGLVADHGRVIKGGA